ATPPIIQRADHLEDFDSRFSLRSICRLFRSVSMFEIQKQKLERFCHSAAVGRNRNKILCVLHAFQVLTRSARSTSVNSVLRPLAERTGGLSGHGQAAPATRGPTRQSRLARLGMQRAEKRNPKCHFQSESSTRTLTSTAA